MPNAEEFSVKHLKFFAIANIDTFGDFIPKQYSVNNITNNV